MAEGQWNRSRWGSSESGSLTVSDARSGHFTLFAWNWPKLSATARCRCRSNSRTPEICCSHVTPQSAELELWKSAAVWLRRCPSRWEMYFHESRLATHTMRPLIYVSTSPILRPRAALCEFLLVYLHIITGFSSQFNALLGSLMNRQMKISNRTNCKIQTNNPNNQAFNFVTLVIGNGECVALPGQQIN